MSMGKKDEYTNSIRLGNGEWDFRDFFPREKVRLLRQYVDEGNNPDKMGDFLIWLMKKESVFGCVCTGNWFDIGIKDILDRAREAFRP